MLKTLHSRFIGLIILFFMLVSASFIASFFTVQTHFIDEETIDLVRNNTPIIQRITRMASNGENPANIGSAVNEYNQNIRSIRTAISRIKANTPIQPTNNIDVRFLDLENSWKSYQITLNSFLQYSDQGLQEPQLENDLYTQTVNISEQSEELAQAVEYFSNARHFLLLRLEVIFLISLSIALLLGYLLIRHRVIKPLSILNLATKRIEQGILNESVEVAGEDEISQLGSSFENMRLAVLTNQTDLEKRIHERTMEIATAFEYSQEIVSQQEAYQIINSVIDRTRILMQAKDASLCLVTPDGCSVELASTTSNRNPEKAQIQSLDENLLEFNLAQNKATATQITKNGCAFLRHLAEDHCLSVPLRIGDQLIGAMCVVRDKEKPFSEDESRAFSLLANSTAIAILNARYAAEARQQAQNAAVKSERERLASELHDNLAQTLNLANLKLSQLEQGKSVTPIDVDMTWVASVKSDVESAIEQLRMIVSEVAAQNHSQLSENEFLQQLDLSINGFRDLAGIPVQVSGTQVPWMQISPLARKQLSMIVNEALTNIRRHAEAKKVDIYFGSDQDNLWLMIADDGKGFLPNVDRGSNHLGIRIMRTRAERSGGSLSIESTLEEGTKITVSFPIER